MKINNYLFFLGKGEAAANFYKDAIGGEIQTMQRFSDGPPDMKYKEEQKDWIMHAHLQFGDNVIMISDRFDDGSFKQGNNFALSIDVTDTAEQDKIFNNLKEGGKVVMELQDTFWGARFGMLQDKFGVDWMVNCHKEK